MNALEGFRKADEAYQAKQKAKAEKSKPGSIWRPTSPGEGPTQTTLVDKNGTSYSFAIETDGNGNYRTRDSETWVALWAAGARPTQG